MPIRVPDGWTLILARKSSPWSVAKVGQQLSSAAVYRNTNAGIRKKLTLQPYPYEKPGSGQRYSHRLG